LDPTLEIQSGPGADAAEVKALSRQKLSPPFSYNLVAAEILHPACKIFVGVYFMDKFP
jgi:hypothetical protein